MQLRSPGTVCFGPYEVRLSTRELFRHGVRVKLPPQAFEVLRVLLERNGELITRQEFHRVLWPADTFVDFDQGLNNAIKRIREVLNDSADSPRYVETLPRLGYRFIGQVDPPQPGFVDQAITNNGAPATVSPESENHQPASPAHTAPPLEVRSGTTVHRRVAAYLLAAAAGVALLATAWLFRPGYPAPHIAGERQLTADGIPKWGPLATDGLRVYFTEKVDGRETVAAVPVSGGQAVPIKMPLAQAGLYGISPDKTDLLVAETPDMFQEAQLWRVPVIGGTPRRLGNAAAHDASWSPDGTKLAYVNRSAIYLANADGSEPRLLVPPVNNPSIWAWRPTWSPDGRRLRFDYFNMDSDASHIWEVNLDGSNAHAVFAPSPDWPLQAFGDWTPDGRYYVFSSWNERESTTPSPAANLWAVREKSNFFHRNSSLPANLTTGPIRYFVHTFSLDGKTIFALSSLKHGELMRCDARTKRLSLYDSGLSAEGVSFSRDGKWMAYVKYPQGELWRSRADGSEPLQLSSQPLFATSPVWSPDGKQIAFTAMRTGEAWHTYVVSAEGSEPQRISEVGDGVDPGWLPDGSLLMVDQANGVGAFVLLNLHTGHLTPVPGSKGLFSPRISPDGRWIVAVSNDLQKLLLFDFHTQAWTDLVRTPAPAWPHWSGDSRYVYFARTGADLRIMRIGVKGGTPEQFADLKDFRATGVLAGWFSLTPNGDLLLLHDTGGGTEIYALSFDAP